MKLRGTFGEKKTPLSLPTYFTKLVGVWGRGNCAYRECTPVKEKDAVVSNNFNLLFWLVAIPKI
jgi:hypothetical protein